MAVEVVLMLGLSLPKRARWNYLRHNGAGPEATSVNRRDRVRRDAHLETSGIEHCRPIARTDIAALAMPCGWIVDLEKKLYEASVARLSRTEHHLYGLRVGPNTLMRGPRMITTDVSDPRSDDVWITA
jgi:hypothetical protein